MLDEPWVDASRSTDSGEWNQTLTLHLVSGQIYVDYECLTIEQILESLITVIILKRIE